MREDSYNKNYRAREYDRSSDLDQKPKKKTSFLTVILIGLLVLLVCSIGYDNIIKPYLEKRGEQTEKAVVTSGEEIDESTTETADMTSIETDDYVPKFGEEPVRESQPVPSEKVSTPTSPAPAPVQTSVPATSQPEMKPTTKPAESMTSVPSSRQHRESETSTPSKSDDHNGLSTLEIMERRNHANVVKQAQRAGVSTEGTTLDIMERINHANVVKQAQRAGVSTEGTTLEIMERINRKNMQRMGY